MQNEERAAALRERIETAFVEVPMPSCDEMIQFDTVDERHCATLLGGKPCRDVDVSMSLIECFLHMPLPAVHYYFPAALLFVLDHRYRAVQHVAESLIGYFDRRSGHKYPQFSALQRQCIIDWLQFVLDNMRESGEEDPSAYDFDRLIERFKRRLPIIKEQWVAKSDDAADLDL